MQVRIRYAVMDLTVAHGCPRFGCCAGTHSRKLQSSDITTCHAAMAIDISTSSSHASTIDQQPP